VCRRRSSSAAARSELARSAAPAIIARPKAARGCIRLGRDTALSRLSHRFRSMCGASSPIPDAPDAPGRSLRAFGRTPDMAESRWRGSRGVGPSDPPRSWRCRLSQESGRPRARRSSSPSFAAVAVLVAASVVFYAAARRAAARPASPPLQPAWPRHANYLLLWPPRSPVAPGQVVRRVVQHLGSQIGARRPS
jgi:hypothetical protein